MIISYLIYGIYSSFIMDFLIWPIPSEASTMSLLKRGRKQPAYNYIFLGTVYLINLLFYIAPLILTLISDLKDALPRETLWTYTGLSIAVLGRVITLKGALLLRGRKHDQLIKNSLFKYSRNPFILVKCILMPFFVIKPKWIQYVFPC